MRKIIILLAVGSLLLVPLYSLSAQGQGVGVIDTEPDISNAEIERRSNGYNLNFTVTHLNGVDSIHIIEIGLFDWTNTNRRNFVIELDENNTRYHGDVPGEINITTDDTREGIDESREIFMRFNINIDDRDYSKASIEVTDVYENQVEKEVQFPSLISGRNISMFTFPLAGLIAGITVFHKYQKNDIDINILGEKGWDSLMEAKHWIVYGSLLFIIILGLIDIITAFAFISVLSPTVSTLFLTPAGFIGMSSIAGIVSILFLVLLLYVFVKHVFEHKDNNKLYYNKERSIYLLPFYLIAGISLSIHLFYTPIALTHIFTFIFFVIFVESTYEYLHIVDLQPIRRLNASTLRSGIRSFRNRLTNIPNYIPGVPYPTDPRGRSVEPSAGVRDHDELNEKFTRGEISVDEYIEMRKSLGSGESKKNKEEVLNESHRKLQSGEIGVEEFLEMRKGGMNPENEGKKERQILNDSYRKFQAGEMTVDEFIEQRKGTKSSSESKKRDFEG